jgi:hypothetical protein
MFPIVEVSPLPTLNAVDSCFGNRTGRLIVRGLSPSTLAADTLLCHLPDIW